jgi:hypothetical protein
MEDPTNTVAADEGAALLKARGYDEATVARFHQAALNGDTEQLSRQWFASEMKPLHDARSLSEYRPVYTAGTFPEAPPERGPGGRVLRGDQLLARVRSRAEAFARWGERDAIAASGGKHADPIL